VIAVVSWAGFVPSFSGRLFSGWMNSSSAPASRTDRFVLRESDHEPAAVRSSLVSGNSIFSSDNWFGPGIFFTNSNHQHRPWIVGKRVGIGAGWVRIGTGCRIGANAGFEMNVELGDRCVVRAGTVVRRSFPADGVVVGVPARPIERGVPC